MQRKLFPNKMPSSSDGNASETSEQTETFDSSEGWGWIQNPSESIK